MLSWTTKDEHHGHNFQIHQITIRTKAKPLSFKHAIKTHAFQLHLLLALPYSCRLADQTSKTISSFLTSSTCKLSFCLLVELVEVNATHWEVWLVWTIVVSGVTKTLNLWGTFFYFNSYPLLAAHGMQSAIRTLSILSSTPEIWNISQETNNNNQG